MVRKNFTISAKDIKTDGKKVTINSKQLAKVIKTELEAPGAETRWTFYGVVKFSTDKK